ncbi:MAG: Thiamine pyrophosphokinase [Deltaproteobacteria bacterium ADurb.Bin510]|nr:MAG: Thiamine pyrophosphokinase [Deltaproteobacteria bacterium ADurb.Bin510]
MFEGLMILIVCGGDDPGGAQLRRFGAEAGLLIAADRGARYCLAAGLAPDVVVGDMDSLAPVELDELAGRGARLVRHRPDKDQTDSQLAVDLALEQSPASICLLGAAGDRLDHSLANIHLLLRAARRGVAARLITGAGDELFLVGGEFELTSCAGRTVSILPFAGRASGVTLEGFRYPLNEAVMEPWEPYGVSNVIESARAVIRVRAGWLLIMLLRPDLA